MKFTLYIFCVLSINCYAQGAYTDSLNQGECWDIQYQNVQDLGLKRYEIGIRYYDDNEFIVNSLIFIADSIELFNGAIFFGQKENPNDTTLNDVEMDYLNSNELILDTKYSITSLSPKQLYELTRLENVICDISYTLETKLVKSYPMSKYYELQTLYNKLVKTESATDIDGFFISTFCILGCEGCYESSKIRFFGKFEIAKYLDLIN